MSNQPSPSASRTNSPASFGAASKASASPSRSASAVSDPVTGQPEVSAGSLAIRAGAAMPASAAAASAVLACLVMLPATAVAGVATGSGGLPGSLRRPPCAENQAATSSICWRFSVRIAPPMIDSARVPA
ncbi:MAG: hypothetical protein KJ049_05715 [Gammaproteobacteria bacterium]|nr:hypothetical protein [Gammaproteobacteria bacterium]